MTCALLLVKSLLLLLLLLLPPLILLQLITAYATVAAVTITATATGSSNNNVTATATSDYGYSNRHEINQAKRRFHRAGRLDRMSGIKERILNSRNIKQIRNFS